MKAELTTRIVGTGGRARQVHVWVRMATAFAGYPVRGVHAGTALFVKASCSADRHAVRAATNQSGSIDSRPHVCNFRGESQ